MLNIGALVVDVGAMALPFVPAGMGLVVRGGKTATKVVTHGDEAVKAVRLAGKAANAGAGLRRFQEVGTEVLPDILNAFGDGVRAVGDVPAALRDRGTRVIGRWWDTEVAEEYGQRIFKPAVGTNWDETVKANYAWIEDAIRNGDVIYLASPVDLAHLRNQEYGIAVFARELDALLQAGYRRVGNYLIPPH